MHMKKQTQNTIPGQEQNKEEPLKAEEKTEDVWKEKYIRALADYQNLEKRTREEHHQVRMFAGLVVIEKLLPVVDLLEKAEEHLKDQGLELALKELYSFYYSIGVEKIEVVGKLFDPHIMECSEVVEHIKDNEVIEEVRAGYTMHGKVIRVARVKVGKKLEEKDINCINKD